MRHLHLHRDAPVPAHAENRAAVAVELAAVIEVAAAGLDARPIDVAQAMDEPAWTATAAATGRRSYTPSAPTRALVLRLLRTRERIQRQMEASR